jgi:hypothetical protein
MHLGNDVGKRVGYDKSYSLHSILIDAYVLMLLLSMQVCVALINTKHREYNWNWCSTIAAVDVDQWKRSLTLHQMEFFSEIKAFTRLNFSSFSLNYCPRACNKVADYLANFGSKMVNESGPCSYLRPWFDFQWFGWNVWLMDCDSKLEKKNRRRWTGTPHTFFYYKPWNRTYLFTRIHQQQW